MTATNKALVKQQPLSMTFRLAIGNCDIGFRIQRNIIKCFGPTVRSSKFADRCQMNTEVLQHCMRAYASYLQQFETSRGLVSAASYRHHQREILTFFTISNLEMRGKFVQMADSLFGSNTMTQQKLHRLNAATVSLFEWNKKLVLVR
jgi:hypothetical protein